MQCLACDNQNLKTRFRLESYKIVGCDDCGTMFNESMYEDPNFRTSQFEAGYYEHIQSNAFDRRLEKYQTDPSVKVYDKYLQLIEKTKRPGTILDVGCAFGTFLKVASNRGWTPKGVELSPFSSEQARKTWGFDIFTGDLNDCPFPDESIDVLTFWDVIEHVPYPKKNLEKVYRLLKKDGLLLITTDNYKSLISSIASMLYKMTGGKFKYPVRKFYIPYNTCYFTPENMKSLLEHSGFKPFYFEKIDYPLEKMNLSPAEKIIVASLYKAGDLLNMNSQFIYIAQKE